MSHIISNYNFKGEFQEIFNLDSDALEISKNYRNNLIDVLSPVIAGPDKLV